MRFCNNNLMLLWVKTPILLFLDLGGRGGKSSTVTTTHVTASQNWVPNKPKTLLWHSEPRNQWKGWYITFWQKKKRNIFFISKIFHMTSTVCLWFLWTLSTMFTLGTGRGGHPFLRTYLWWNLCNMYHVPWESYRRRFGSFMLLYLCYAFWALINPLVCLFSNPRSRFSYIHMFVNGLSDLDDCWTLLDSRPELTSQ